MEKATNVVAVPFTGTWSDLGSWDGMGKMDQDGLRFHQMHILFSVEILCDQKMKIKRFWFRAGEYNRSGYA